MNIKIKVALSIGITLAIGIFIGALLNRALVQRRIARALAFSNPKTFSLWYENRLGLDPEKSQQIKAILDAHAQTTWEIREEYMQEMQTAGQELHSKLAPLLTPEQKRQLDRGPFSPGRGPGRDFRPPPPPGQNPGLLLELHELKDSLSLTEEQYDRLSSQLGKPSLSPQPTRRRVQDPDAIFNMWLERERNKDKILHEILDDDQKQIYAQIKEERRKKLRKILEKLIQEE